MAKMMSKNNLQYGKIYLVYQIIHDRLMVEFNFCWTWRIYVGLSRCSIEFFRKVDYYV